MKLSYKVSLAVLSAVAFLGPIAAHAATTPSVGTAATYAILSSTYTNTSAGTTINGDVGFTTPPAVIPLGAHTNYGSVASYATAGTDQGSALSALASQGCTFTFANGPIDLTTDTTHGTIGVYTPGVYCTGASSAASIGTSGITLNGAGTYIFRITGALTSVANSAVTLTGGASSCDVFWTPTAATTLGANSTFVGTNIDASGITVGNSSSWTGRALAFGGTVTTNTDTITAPACGGTPPPPSVTETTTTTATTSTTTIAPVVALSTTITVIKTVINDNGGIRTVASFPLSVNGTPVVSGVTNTFPIGIYAVNETGDSNYTRTFSGDCDINGVMDLVEGDNKTCTITNNDNVAVVVPKLPNTGLPPRSGTGTPWDIFITAGILMVVSTSLVLALKKRTI